MKRITIGLMLLATVFAASTISSQERMITCHVSGDVWDDGGTAKLVPGGTYIFTLHYHNTSGEPVRGITNGIRLYGPGSWDVPAADYIATTDICQYFDLACQFAYFGVDGTGADTIGLSASVMTSAGIPGDFDADVWTVTTGGVADGEQLCLDSCFYPPSNAWLWAPGENPGWGGPYCSQVQYPPPPHDEVTNCPEVPYTGDHCVPVIYDFDAYSFEGDSLFFGLISGPGYINYQTGVWSYQPSLLDVGMPIELVVGLWDEFAGLVDECQYVLNFTNEAPVFGPMQSSCVLGAEDTLEVMLTGQSVDCDSAYAITLEDVIPDPQGTFELQDSLFWFVPADGFYSSGDVGQEFEFQFQISDGIDATTESVYINVVDYDCCLLRGDVDVDGTASEITDLVYLVAYMFGEGPTPVCMGNADFNGNEQGPDITDLVYLVSYMFSSGPPPVPCP